MEQLQFTGETNLVSAKHGHKYYALTDRQMYFSTLLHCTQVYLWSGLSLFKYQTA